MGDYVPVPSGAEDGLAADLLLDRVRAEIRSGVGRGGNFLDVARRAGLSESLALVLVDNDNEMRELYDLSRERPRNNESVANGHLQRADPVEIKHQYLRDLAEAGLFSKSVEMVRQAQPTDELGARIIEGHLRYVAKELWPKESKTQTQKKSDDDVLKEASLDQLEAQVEQRRQKRLGVQAKIIDAKFQINERASRDDDELSSA